MPTKKLKEFLDSNHVKYSAIRHSPAFTAQQVAESAHIPGKEMAKTVIIKLDNKLVMVVLPSNMKVDMDELKSSTGAHRAELASESEFKSQFPECEVGAMPPFGNLFGMETYMDKTLSKDKEIAFNAGLHSEIIRLTLEDFIRLAHPKILQ